MRRRRIRSSIGNVRNDNDGILDILANLIGILTLVGALSAIVAANTAVKIKTPMSRSTEQDFVLLVAGDKGIWNLQPAKEALYEAQKQRLVEMRACLDYGLYGMASCIDRAQYKTYSNQVGAGRFLVNDSETSVQRNGPPDIHKVKNDDLELHKFLETVKSSGKAIFILLEKEGFESYRELRSAAAEVQVNLGWEPWDTNEKVYFGGNGRTMTVQ